MNKPDLRALFQQARHAHAQGQFEEAERLYRQILSVNPREKRVLLLLARLCDQTGRAPAAVKLARESLKAGGRSFKLLCFLGGALARAGDRNGARHAFISALDLPTTDLNALATLGVALRDHAAPREAEDCFRRALAKYPDHAGVRNALGGLLLIRGALEDALAEFDMALRVAPGMVSRSGMVATTAQSA